MPVTAGTDPQTGEVPNFVAPVPSARSKKKWFATPDERCTSRSLVVLDHQPGETPSFAGSNMYRSGAVRTFSPIR